MADTIITTIDRKHVILKKSKRSRRFSIRIRQDGQITVVVPYRATEADAVLFYQSKKLWVNRQLSIIKPSEHILQHGQRIGKTHTLFFRHSPESACAEVKRDIILVSLPNDMSLKHPQAQTHAKNGVFKALKIQSKSYLPIRLEQLAKKFGFSYKSVRLKNTSTRWGSCSSTGNINLNIQLMRLPNQLIDYVILHELCHLEHPNHSGNFWNLLESIIPSAKSYRKTLRQYSLLYKS